MSSIPRQDELAHSPGQNGDGDNAEDRLVQLRGILIGPELAQLDAIKLRLDDPLARSEDLSKSIAEAISIRAKQDRKLQVTLQPLIEEALRISVARDPAMLATSLFPIIGEAVRKAVSKALRGSFDSLNQMLDRSISWESWKWRFEAWRSGKSFGEIALMRGVGYRVEEVFLIHRETGLLIQHAAAADGVVADTDLISGMLTAIQDFVRDSFGVKKSDELEVMEVGEFKLWLQHGPLVLLAAVVSGLPPPELRQVFEREIEEIHANFGAELAAFDGDSTPLAGVSENLQRCLLGRKAPEAPGKSQKSAWVLAALLLLAAVLVGLRVRDNRRWNAYIQTLRSEPGIVVTDAQRRWRSYSVNGLRDPLAPDPRLLLSSYSIAPEKVSGHWEPYLSLDPKFSAARKVEALKEVVNKQVLRFELNSTQLRTDQFALLDLIADQIRELERAALADGQKTVIEVYGHADRTGKEERNAMLSQGRAETVARVLQQRGISGQALAAAGRGTSDPEHESNDYPSELDRRVTFRVITSPAGPAQ